MKLITKPVIYIIRNITNNKIYLGSAINFRLRFNQHMYNLRKNKHHSIYFQRAWNKCGKDNFSFEVLELIEDKNKLTEREQVWLNFFNPEYNICKVAGSQLGRHWKVSEQGRINLRKAAKGRKLSEAHKKSLSLLHLGKKKNPESVAKMKATKKGKPWTEARRIAQLKIRKDKNLD